MGDESELDAWEHHHFLGYILNRYGLSWDNVVCLMRDKCNRNRSIANLANLPLICCASHHFQLAVREIINIEAELIKKVHKVIVKLKGLLLSARNETLHTSSAKTKQSNSVELNI